MRTYPSFKLLVRDHAVANGIVHRALWAEGRTLCGRDLRDTVNYCDGPTTCEDCIAVLRKHPSLALEDLKNA